MPTDDDILRARLPTVGVQEHKITLEHGPERGSVWYIFDVGGARSQRATWEPFFDDGTRNLTCSSACPLPASDLTSFSQ
jgi:hypothetical protein